MEPIAASLLSKLSRVREYLASKKKADANGIYQNIATEIDSLLDELPRIKPKIKLVSSQIALSKQLKAISEQDANLNQQYQLQIIPPGWEIQQILNGCEFILLVWESQEKVSTKEQRLIQQAIDSNLGLLIAIVGHISADINSWLAVQTNKFSSEVIFLSPSFLVVTDPGCVNQYQQRLTQLLSIARVKLETRLSQKLIRKINQIVRDFNQKKQEKIAAVQLSCSDNEIDLSRQHLNQLMQKTKQRQTHCLQEIKGAINYQKSLLLNPFTQDSLIWSTQEIISQSDIKITRNGKETYLVPIVKTDNKANKANNSEKKLYLYLADLYQFKFQAYFNQEWDKCNHTYGNGGLKQLRQELEFELRSIAHLCDITMESKAIALPEFQLSNLAYLPILEAGSKIVFDNHFSDSKWFRLLIAVGIGAIIFIVTLLLFGEGRFFGFVIVIFQFINLFTGRDARTVKLAQQTKELKRTLDNKYQVLIRLCAEKITRDLIAAVDHEQRFYQQQLDAIALATNEQLSTANKSIEGDRQEINQLKQDRQHILSLLND
jgi:hypothetical protein